tara:strand:- start:1322 stop:1474 length:153 start_codon:yes stop_codon:yes gene_type:complete
MADEWPMNENGYTIPRQRPWSGFRRGGHVVQAFMVVPVAVVLDEGLEFAA